jgi:transcriptional regulator with XRE-family HTH domain
MPGSSKPTEGSTNETHSDEDLQALGRVIRRLRKDAGLTLSTVAKQAGVSTSLISQVERGLAQPSLTTLRGIASALDVRLSALFHDSRVGESSTLDFEPVTDEGRYVVRGYSRKKLYGDHAGVDYELLAPDTTSERRSDFLLGVFAPGSSSPSGTSRYVAHEGEEYCYCTSGSLTLLLGTEEFTIDAGDSIAFDASIPHRVENRGTVAAEVTITMTPPWF